jgi:hypothetical protein
MVSKEYGANSYVQKPLTYTEFEMTIHKILSYWFDVNVSSTPESNNRLFYDYKDLFSTIS